MKNNRLLLFVSLGVAAMGVGFLSSCSSKNNNLSFEDETVFLGRYPQTITDENVQLIQTEGVLDSTTGWYTYNEKEYAILTVKIDGEYLETAQFNNNIPAKDLNGSEAAFLVEDLKWEIFSVGKGYADIITTRIIDRQVFNDSGIKHYYESSLFAFNNSKFFKSAFSEKERKYIQVIAKKYECYVDLPDESLVKSFKDNKLQYPSDYAIASYLSGKSPSGGSSYMNGPYWTRGITYEGDRIIVQWSAVNDMTNCVPGDSKIGVRPIIRVAYNGTSGGGGGETTPTTKPTSSGGGNAALGFGIAFTIIGAGGLVAFFIMWAKKHPSGKPPIWLLASLAGALVISITGLGCLAGGLAGNPTKIVGWYQGNMSDAYAGDEVVAINVTKDGKVYRYVGSVWDSSNFTYYLQPGVGTYKYSNGKLTIYAPEEWKLNSWEMPTTTYNGCNGISSFLKYQGYVGTAYQWYHYSHVDSKGVASLKYSDTHDSGKLIW